MRYFILLVLFLVINPNSSQALSCAMVGNFSEQYLIVIKKIDTNNTIKNEYRISSSAEVDVLRVYKWNIDEISKVKQINLNMACDNVWGIKCNELDDTFANTFKEGNHFIINTQSINIHKCGDTSIFIENSEKLNNFEKTNPPIWIK